MDAQPPLTIENEIEKKDKNKEDIIIEKWKKLQEIILEEKSLIDVLFKYKNDDYSEIKNLIIDYSETKLKIRQINYKGKKKNKEKQFQISTKINQFSHNNTHLAQEIQKFLFFLRKNIDYILKIISLIDENDDNYEFKSDSLVELLCNQFYDKLPSKNNKHKHLMLIIYVLLEKEICGMDYAMVDNFLNTNYFLEKLLDSFCKKEEFTKYLSKLLNPLLSSIEKEVEDNDILNLSLFEIKEYINNKNNNKNTENKNKIDNKELTDIIWKNCDEFVDELTQKKLYNLIKNEKNNDNKEIYKLHFERSFYNLYNYNEEQNIYSSNNKLIEVLNNDCFNENIVSIINKYKKNYLFIHQKIDIFLLGLINDIKLIPNNIRYICKIIYILISKKFPGLPKYLKNSFIGKFFFNQYVFPGLILENKLIFENKIISLEAKKFFGEIICLLSHANKCLLFNNNDNIEKAIFNNYLIQIIPILDKFYTALIDIKLPKFIDKLINLKLKELELSNKKKKIIRRKKDIEVENIISINNVDNDKNISINNFIKDKNKNKNKKYSIENSLWNLEYICFSINDLLYILKLINKNQNIFINLKKNEIFFNMFQSFLSKKSQLESIIKEDENTQLFYIVFNNPLCHLYDDLKNQKKKNLKIFSQNPNNISSDSIINNIKISLKMLLQELEIINKRRYTFLNKAFSNEKFFKYLYYSSLELDQHYIIEKYKKMKIPLCWYGKYLINNINYLNKNYSENDYQEIYNLLYNDELYNLNELKKYWDIIITRNDEKIKLSENIINKKKLNLEHIQNSNTFERIEKVIYLSKMEVYVRVDVANKSETNPPIIIEDVSPNPKKTDLGTLINNIEEFINIFSENSLICDPISKIKPYDLIILDIVDGKNDNLVYNSILNYLSIVKTKIKDIYPEIREKERNKMIESIKEYILKSLFKLVFPKTPLKEDTSFYEKTQLLDWVKPENFAIKNIDFAQLTFAESLIKKFEDSKSLDEKLNCIFNMHAYINNIFKFNTGKDTEIGQDELTPVLQYLIIKIQPRRIISNINYLKCFLNDEDLISKKGFLMSQIDSAVTFVLSINYYHLNISEEEYNKNIENSKKRNNLI